MKIFPYGPWAAAPTGALNFARFRLAFQNPEAYRLHVADPNPEILTDCKRELLMVLLSSNVQVEQVFGVLNFEARRGGEYTKAEAEVLASGRCPLLAKDLVRGQAMAEAARPALKQTCGSSALELVTVQKAHGNLVLADVALRSSPTQVLTVKLRSMAQAMREVQHGTWSMESEYLAWLNADTSDGQDVIKMTKDGTEAISSSWRPSPIVVVEPEAPHRATVLVLPLEGSARLRFFRARDALPEQRGKSMPMHLTPAELQTWAHNALLTGGAED